MKWPSEIILIRHGESAYNELKQAKEKHELYQSFRKKFEENPSDSETIDLAKKVVMELTLDKGDNATPLTEIGREQAYKTGERLRQIVELPSGQPLSRYISKPDKIFVSPHLRTKQTLEEMSKGWPELTKVSIVEEVNIREQEHGLALIYNDWRVFHTLHPEQRLLHKLEGPYWYRYPQGESVPDVQTRIKLFFNTIIREYSGENIMIVTHHLTILTIINMLERTGSLEFIRMDEEEKPVNCGVTIFKFDTTSRKLERVLYNQKYW